MKSLILNLEDETNKKLKILAAQNETSLHGIIVKILNEKVKE